MKFTDEQEYKFTDEVCHDKNGKMKFPSLTKSVEWIAANLKPEEVYCHKQLMAWHLIWRITG